MTTNIKNMKRKNLSKTSSPPIPEKHGIKPGNKTSYNNTFLKKLIKDSIL